MEKEKEKVKVCAHFNKKKLRAFEKKIMARDSLHCDTCCNPKNKNKKLQPENETPEGTQIANLLVCLSCFEIGCNRHTSNSCMLKHGEKERHHVTYSLSYGAIWCYLCDYELKEFLIENGVEGTKEEMEASFQKMPNGLVKKFLSLKGFIEEIDMAFGMLVQKERQKDLELQKQKIEIENDHQMKDDSSMKKGKLGMDCP